MSRKLSGRVLPCSLMRTFFVPSPDRSRRNCETVSSLAPLVLRREHAVGLPVGLAEHLAATEAPLQRVDALVAVGLDLEDDGAVALRFERISFGAAPPPSP